MARRLNQYGCPQPSLTPEQAQLEEYRRLYARLLQQAASGIQEIENPQLGRTQYRPLEEIQAQMRMLEGLMDKLAGGPVEDLNAWRRTRRPIYPVAREY
jgi:hypothetical protein